MKIAVVGAHLQGLPLHVQLTDRHATLVLTTRTRPVYRFFALPGTTPPKPGLLRTHVTQSTGIEVEVYEIGAAGFASFVDLIPPPLTIGNLELETGESVKGFLVEAYATEGAIDITHTGGWRAYLATLA